MMRAIAFLVLATVLLGCASNKAQPRISYYQLPDSTQQAEEGSVGMPSQRLSVARVSTSDILAQTGIVTASADARVVVANYHHWSELPELALQRNLNKCLRTRESRSTGKVSLEVEAFQSDGAGGSLFAGVWNYAAAAQPRSAKPYRFHYRQALDDDGYAALVSALALSVQQLCSDIEKQLQ